MTPNPHLPGDEPWEPALRHLRAQAAAGPRPFLYTRLRARQAAAAALPTPLAWLSRRPAFIYLLAALALVLNLGALARYRPATSPAPPVPASAYATFVAEYNLAPPLLPRE